MTRFRGALIGGCLVALLLVVLTLAGRPAEGGPLQRELPSNAVTFSVAPGMPFTYGGLQIHNLGAEPVTLDEVRLEGASEGLRVEGAYALRISDTTGELWFNFGEFPPPGLPAGGLHPLAGFEVPPDHDLPMAGLQALLALSVPVAGRYEFSSIVVEYHVGGRRYEASYPFAMRVCASPAATAQCPQLPPAG